MLLCYQQIVALWRAEIRRFEAVVLKVLIYGRAVDQTMRMLAESFIKFSTR
jgi:hypothetical protein